MHDKVRHVDAVFGGKPVRFEWRPLPALTADERPLATFQRFALGEWTLGDLREVLARSLPPRPERPFGMGNERDVAAVLDARPPAPYALLAAKVLEAYLFGLAPTAATFDEREAAA